MILPDSNLSQVSLHGEPVLLVPMPSLCIYCYFRRQRNGCPSDLAPPFYSVARHSIYAHLCRQRIREGNQSLSLYYWPVQPPTIGCLRLNGERLAHQVMGWISFASRLQIGASRDGAISRDRYPHHSASLPTHRDDIIRFLRGSWVHISSIEVCAQ